MKKNEFKAIVKECLVELLAEGLGQTLVESRHKNVVTSVQPVQERRKHPLESVSFVPKSLQKQPQPLLSGRQTTNSVLAELAQDTLVHTLPEQIQHGHTPSVNQSRSQEPFPDESFSSPWSALAFNEVKKR